jgi:hypothetical protein
MKIKNSCVYKESSIVADTAQINYMLQYFSSNNITGMQQHPSGVFYKINNPGTGATASLCNTVSFNYAVYKMGYSIAFDSHSSTQGVAFSLGDLIIGVQKTTPLIHPGGSITMYIPPSLAYGSQVLKDQNGNVLLPANSYLRFEMNLISVQ